MAFPIHFNAAVKTVVRHNENLATYVLVPTGRFPKFKPGQFVHVTLEPYDPSSHWPESRAFSVASAPSNKAEIRLTVGRQGAYTARILDEVKEGQTLALKGPYGELVVAPTSPADEVVLIAGGTGITPFCSYLEEASLVPAKHTNPVHLFYAVKHPSAFIYRESVQKYAQSIPHLRIHFYAEQEADAHTTAGRLNLVDILSKLPNPHTSSFYLSGPQAMIKNFSEALVNAHGIEPHRVFIDAWQ
jgi:ferredoxin-NADP reductase